MRSAVRIHSSALFYLQITQKRRIPDLESGALPASSCRRLSRRQVLRSPEVQRVDREAAEALHQLETSRLDLTPHGGGPTVVRVAKALRHREDPSRLKCRVELAPCRLPVAHLAEHKGEEDPVESFPLQRPLAEASLQDADVGHAFCLQPMLELFEHRTLAVEGDDLPARFYRSRDGDSQPPGTTACIQYPHAGSEAEPLDQELGACESFHERVLEEEGEPRRGRYGLPTLPQKPGDGQADNPYQRVRNYL